MGCCLCCTEEYLNIFYLRCFFYFFIPTVLCRNLGEKREVEERRCSATARTQTIECTEIGLCCNYTCQNEKKTEERKSETAERTLTFLQ